MRKIQSFIAGLFFLASSYAFAQNQIYVASGVTTSSGCSVPADKMYAELHVEGTSKVESVSLFGISIHNVTGVSRSSDLYPPPEVQCSAGASVSIVYPGGGLLETTVAGLPAKLLYGYQIYTGASYESSPVVEGLFSDGAATFISTGESVKIDIYAILTSPSGKAFRGGESFSASEYLDISFTD